MTEKRLFAGWLRSLTGLAAAAGILALSACGGGSGAPNNTLQRPLEVLPNPIVVYSGVPSLLSITRGTGPFRAVSSNSGVLPVAQNVASPNIVLLANAVVSDTDVTITIDDLAPSAAADSTRTRATVLVTVRPNSFPTGLTITPATDDCGTNVCSGQTATASIVGSLLAGRAVRFDVMGSAYAIVTNNPAQPLAATLTVVADSNGRASVVIKVNSSAPTQAAQISVTDVASGQQLVGAFTIVENTDGSTILTVVPDTATIKGAFTGVCSSGFVIDYYIYGGTPPYRVTSTFPNSVSLTNTPVNTNGGFFRATTNGACVNPLTFSIVDATGLQTTAELNNVEGENAPAATVPPLSVTPQVIPTGAGNCDSLNAVVLVTGGTAPYNIVQTSAAAPGVAPVLLPAPGTTALVFPASPDIAVDYVFVVQDSSNPKKSSNITYNCN